METKDQTGSLLDYDDDDDDDHIIEEKMVGFFSCALIDVQNGSALD
jgi:hypothetical protein